MEQESVFANEDAQKKTVSILALCACFAWPPTRASFYEPIRFAGLSQ